jgi:hypothetical protein
MIKDNETIRQAAIAKYSNVARALLGLIRECLGEIFGERPYASRAELETALQRVDDSWPHIVSLFDFAYADWLNSLRFIADERRNDYLTRILMAKLLARADDQKIADSRSFFRKAAPFLQRWFASLLSPDEWTVLNNLSREIVSSVYSDNDNVLISAIHSGSIITISLDNICINLAVKFIDFPRRQVHFMAMSRDMRTQIGRDMTIDEYFCIFDLLFLEYCEAAARPDKALRIGMLHGTEKLEKLLKVAQACKAARKGGGKATAAAGSQTAPDDNEPPLQADWIEDGSLAAMAWNKVAERARSQHIIDGPSPPPTLPQVNLSAILGKAYKTKNRAKPPSTS